MNGVTRVEFFRPPSRPTGGTVYVRPSDSDRTDMTQNKDVEGRSAPDLLAQVPGCEAVRLHPGDKVRFSAQKQRYTVQAVTPDGRYAICTKPFNARKTVLYTIVDFLRNVRGPDNLIFSWGYETPQDIQEDAARLERGDMEVSYRRCVPLDIVEVFSCGDPSGPYASPECVS